ncbi:MAG: MATE family efflux transporter [Bacteroidales bacterium]|nr:MATE family efflux transporter [Bacteroidales bacterium]
MKLNREILRLAIPSILANITVPLVGMVDIAVVGHLSGTDSAALIGGIAIGTMLFDLLYWNFGFLRVGTGGLTAQAFGRGDSTDSILRRALRIALLSGVGLIALQWVVVWLAFLVVDCSPHVQALATQYFYIRIWAAPATLSLFAFKGWFIGLQDSVRPMTADLLVNGLNILLSIGLGFGVALPGGSGITLIPTLGFAGVALGTVIAQWTGFAYCLLAARRRYSFEAFLLTNLESARYINSSRLNRGEEKLEISGFKQVSKNGQLEQRAQGSFFTLNRDLFLRSVGMIAVYIGFTVISARFGDRMLAVSTILMKLLMIFSYFTDGFAYAGEALTGRFIGERSADGLRSTIRGTFAWSFGLAGVFMLLYGLGGVPAFRLMTADPVVVDAGREFLPWLLLMPLIGCPAFAWDGIFIGATASRDLRNSTLLCALGFFAVWFIGVNFTHTPQAAIHLLMAAYFVHLAIRALYLTLRARPAVLAPLYQYW